jgi:hypothetical protein
MYENFTDRARKVLQLANQEAQRLGHEYIGTEHILLGILSEGASVAVHAMKKLGVDLHDVRRGIAQIILPGRGISVSSKLPQTPRSKKVIEYSIEEARDLHHNYVGTEHLLLGLLREQEGVAAQVLMNLGLKLEDVREEVLNLLGTTTEPPSADVRAAEIPPGRDLNSGLVHLPDAVIQAFAEINERLRMLKEAKEEAIAEQDFVKASRLRDKHTILQGQLRTAAKMLRSLICETEDESA